MVDKRGRKPRPYPWADPWGSASESEGRRSHDSFPAAKAVHHGGGDPVTMIAGRGGTVPCPPDLLPAARPAPARREADGDEHQEGHRQGATHAATRRGSTSG